MTNDELAADFNVDVSGDTAEPADAAADWPQLPQIELDVCLAPQTIERGRPPASEETPSQ
jgi:hypothetical protein